MQSLALALAIVGLAVAPATTADAAPPNILFLLTDDQSFETVRAFGHTDIDTPHLDRLVARGTTFTHAYNMGSWTPAVCVASRTMLVTGRSLWRARSIYPATDREREEGRLWPQLMARAGYFTGFTGKWHVNTEVAKVFHEARHIRGGMPGDTPEGYLRPPADKPDPWSPSDPKFGGFWAGGKHWSEVTADDAVAFLEAGRSPAQPFFLYVAFNAPHDPRQSPQAYVERYALDRIAVPTNFLPVYPYLNDIGCGPDLRDEKLAPFPRTSHAVQVHRQEYYALITHLDAQIGRILDALDHSGQADRTWIFFTADQGLAVGHHGLLGKQNLYEHSLRVPFVVAGPGVRAGATIPAPIYLQDVMATALDLANIPRPNTLEFHSLLPLLRGEASPAAREAIYGAYLDLQRAVIHGGWKLLLYPKARVARLYHLAVDPGETRDLSGDPAHAARRQALFQRLRTLQQELADPLDLTAAFPQR
ncbi:MAG: sulfatase-like hydrolase/transferase [Verrucomicrobiales bacterium]|nr:sulfatase-like hydrolase/transferase [Verrucomicrobiales bacterium]